MKIQNIEELAIKLKALAKKTAWKDDVDFMPHEYAGGNIDDAYWGGESDGQICLARELLEEFFDES